MINQLPLFDFFHQLDALGHCEERYHFGKHVLSCLEAFDGVKGVGWAERGKQHRIKVLLQELLHIRSGEGSGVLTEEAVAHVLVVVAARYHVDVEVFAGLVETHSPSETPYSKTDAFFGVEYSDFLNLFHIIAPSNFKCNVNAVNIVLFRYRLFVVMLAIISKPLLKALPVGESW